jgi:hypothetical protein
MNAYDLVAPLRQPSTAEPADIGEQPMLPGRIHHRSRYA